MLALLSFGKSLVGRGASRLCIPAGISRISRNPQEPVFKKKELHSFFARTYRKSQTDCAVTCKNRFLHCLGWKIRSEFRGIPQSILFWTFRTPEFFIGFYFPIKKSVPANSEHVFSGSESSPATILPISWIGKCSPYMCQWQVASNFDTQCTNSFRAHHRQPTAHNI